MLKGKPKPVTLRERPVLDRKGLDEIFAAGVSKNKFCQVTGCSRMSLHRWMAGDDPVSPLATRDLNERIKRLVASVRKVAARRLDEKSKRGA